MSTSHLHCDGVIQIVGGAAVDEEGRGGEFFGWLFLPPLFVESMSNTFVLPKIVFK